MKQTFHALTLIAALVAAPVAMADTLLVDRAQEKPAGALPTRGETMQRVEARFGAPQERLEPRGGQKQQ